MADAFTPLDAILRDGPFSLPTSPTIELYGKTFSTDGTLDGTVKREDGLLVIEFNEPRPFLHGPLGMEFHVSKLALPPDNQMLAEGNGPLGVGFKQVLRIDELE